MNPSPKTISLPSNLSMSQARRTILTHAPELRFKDNERHFPGDPANFNLRARFRESRPGKDRGWNKETQRWVDGDRHEASFHDAPWPDISIQSLVRFPGNEPHDPPRSQNLRPRDKHNRHGGTRGLFIQRAADRGDAESGFNPDSLGFVSAPLFVDTQYHRGPGIVTVLYWFFYDLNWWKVFITHEGDWEHVTYVFEEDAFRAGRAPRWAYFAQHDTGMLLEYRHLKPATGPHRVVYVDPDGHPCRFDVNEAHRYRIRWQTWDESRHQMQFVPEVPWRDFAGAWGEIGETKHTTGPLGPFYKRHTDKVKITLVDGEPHVRIEKP